MPKYCVPIIFRGQDNFIVEAQSPEEATIMAERRFNNGDQPDEFGDEWQEIERVLTPEEMEIS